MADWDTSNPDDNDIVSQYPSNERAARNAVVANFGVDHHETDDDDIGKHEVIQLVDEAGDATIDAGQIGIWNDGGTLKTRVGSGAVNQLARISDVGNAAFAAGTRMLFHQSTTPAGWTQATNVNDRVLRVVSGSTGGNNGGSWTISGLTVQNHALTIGQLPSHDHGGGGNTGWDGAHGHSGSTDWDTHNHDVLLDHKDPTGAPSPTQRVGESGNAPYSLYQRTTNDSHNHGLNINNAPNHRHTYNIPNQGGNQGHNHGITHNSSWRPAYTDIIVGIKD